MNSFRGVRDAITWEVGRQIDLLEGGGQVIQQTRLWDADRGRTEAMRSKEEAHDYRYFPDPDLLPLVLDAAHVAALRDGLPELPAARRRRLTTILDLAADDAATLCEDPSRADAFERALGEDPKPEIARGFAAFLTSRVAGAMNRSERPWSEVQAAMATLYEVEQRWRAGSLSNQMLGDLLTNAFAAADSLEHALSGAMAAAGEVVSDSATLGTLIDAILAAQPAEVAAYRDGNRRLMGFFMGRVMGALAGKGDAKAAAAMLTQRLKG